MSRAQRLRRQMRAVHPQRRVARGQLGSPDIVIPHRWRRTHQVGRLPHRDASAGPITERLLIIGQTGVIFRRAIVQRLAKTLDRAWRNERDHRRSGWRLCRRRHLGPDTARDARCTQGRSGRRGHTQPWQYQHHFAGLLAHRQGWLENRLSEKKQETDLQRQRDQQSKRALAKRRNAGSRMGRNDILTAPAVRED
jgi:hypothetical protein